MKSLITIYTLFMLVFLSLSTQAKTSAGIDIINTATLTYSENDNTVSATSTIQVQEVIDVALSLNLSETTRLVENGDINQTLPYSVQNTGNGTEIFKVDYVNSDSPLENISIVIDANNNGVIDVDENTLNNGDSISLVRDEIQGLIIKADIPISAQKDDISTITLTVSSATEKDGVIAATADPGTLLAGQGTDTTDAIVGESPSQTRTARFQVGDTAELVTITKAIDKSLDPFGGTTNIPGSKVTYNITVVVDASKGPVNNLVIVDSIPADMTYTSGSLSINGVGQTDLQDDVDAGHIENNQVTVDLGNITEDSTFTIKLTAEIK